MRYRIELGKWEKVGRSAEAERRLVIGHRNPDTDSVAAAASFARLKQLQGWEGCRAGCAGLPQKRTRALFERFGVPVPQVVQDVWPRVGDIVRQCSGTLCSGQILLEATEALRAERLERLPVTGDDNTFVGMVSLFDLADRMFQGVGNGEGILDRSVKTTIAHAAKALDAEILCSTNEREISELLVYVGAMNMYHMKSRLLERPLDTAALVVGDRGEIQQLAVEMGIRLLVITGGCAIDPEFVKIAREKGVSVLVTSYDSASTVRRLKFSSPLEFSLEKDSQVFSVSDKLHDIRREVLSANYDGFPVIDGENKFIGMFYKQYVQRSSDLTLTLVDHNELDQAVEGAGEVPVREIIDHHRLSIRPTDEPIRVINDVVGSTCTLVAEQYRQSGLEPEKDYAGIMLGGIVADTLLLRSPTSTGRDREMMEWLSGICDCPPEELEQQMLSSGSPLATLTPEQLFNSDCKKYEENGFSFALGQIEESGFENLSAKRQALQEQIALELQRNGWAFAGLLVTNVVRSTSVMLAAGDPRVLGMLPFEKLEDGMYDLPGVVSRKKQLLPLLLNIFNQLGGAVISV